VAADDEIVHAVAVQVAAPAHAVARLVVVVDTAQDEAFASIAAFLWQQIEALPESYRVLVLLRYQQNLPYEEIASVLSLPLGTVKTGLFRARARLREALGAFEEVPQ